MKKEDKYYTYENKFDYTDKEINDLRNQEKEDKKRYKVLDQVGNRLFPNKIFLTFEDAWAYIDEHVKDTEIHQDLFVVDSKEIEKGQSVTPPIFDIVDWDKVNNLTDKEVDIIYDLLKDIK